MFVIHTEQQAIARKEDRVFFGCVNSQNGPNAKKTGRSSEIISRKRTGNT